MMRMASFSGTGSKCRSLFGAALVISAVAASASQVQTNRTERWVTNLVEVKMQATKLVTEYRTNWSEEVWNNIIDVYSTNHVTKFYTNKIVVDAVRTNVVTAYHTNLKTLHLTNFVTVLEFKTNWVNQPVTNVVSIDLPGRTAAAAPAAASPDSTPASGAAVGQLAMQARRTGQNAPGKPSEIQLTVEANHGSDVPYQVQQWRVERDDGSILLFGQGPEFRRALPVGKYKVEVKARQRGTNQLIAALGTLSVLPEDVLLQQKPATKWVSP